MRALLAVALVLTAGCGDGAPDGPAPGAYSCSAGFPAADGGTSRQALCLDVSGGTAQDFANNRKQCADQGNSFALAPCDLAGAVGGCRERTPGATLTTWYYDTGSTTSDNIRMLCEGLARGVPFGLTIEFVLP